VKGSMLFQNSELRTEIWISKPAMERIGKHELKAFVQRLESFMASVDMRGAMVGKSGFSLTISLWRK